MYTESSSCSVLLPFFLSVFSALHREETEELFRGAGFRLLESHRHEFLVKKDKAELFLSFRSSWTSGLPILSSMSSVRKRLCSGFSMFSDAEIEEGIEEVGIL